MTRFPARRFATLRQHAVLFALLAVLATQRPAIGAQASTGVILGRVVANDTSAPLRGASVDAISPSGRYHAVTADDGAFSLASVTPDTYTLGISVAGYQPQFVRGVVVLPGARVVADAAMTRSLAEIGHVSARSSSTGYAAGETQDVFRIAGEQARGLPSASASGLGSYAQNTLAGAVAVVPGVQQDQFANVILQGGKVQDTVFAFDGVPVPQALIAEPGGNVVGAQLPSTGAAYTILTTGGLSTSSNQGLAGVIDEFPATGVYPAQTNVTLAAGLVPGTNDVEAQSRWATSDLSRRYAVDAEFGNEQIQYGDGRTFYPAEAATYGLSLASRATWSVAADAHVRYGTRDDISFSTLEGQAVYDQYGTPYAGETYGAFNGAGSSFPGEPSPNAQVDTPTRVRGTYAVQKLQDVRTFAHGSVRVELYGSQYGAHAEGPFFDDLSFPNGAISYYGGQNAALYGFGIDAQDVASDRSETSYGAEIRTQRSQLDQFIPTLDDTLTAAPVLNSYLGYIAERWGVTPRLALTGTLRASGTGVVRSDGKRYGMSAVDPHFALSEALSPDFTVLATYDHTTQPPNPLEAERLDAQSPAPFVPLAPEAGDSYEVALEGGGPVRTRLTYFAKSEHNLIDVLPFNVRAVEGSGESPSAVGVPTNAGNLLVHGYELSVETGALSLAATYTRGFSSSASQFGYNDLNAPALAAGHLFPLGYVPDLSAVASYALHLNKRTVLTPMLSYESGYPYGNGRKVWIFDPATGRPEQVANDNYVDPGYNYYFLKNPAEPFNALFNPYVATLGTPEGDDPNTLRTPPKLLASLRLRGSLGASTTLVLDVVNLFANASPTQAQGNPYLIGPPGYTGGNALYQAAYGKILGAGQPYTLGNGITPVTSGPLAGQRPALPWTYGTAGYVPSSYPNARAVYLRLEQKL